VSNPFVFKIKPNLVGFAVSAFYKAKTATSTLLLNIFVFTL